MLLACGERDVPPLPRAQRLPIVETLPPVRPPAPPDPAEEATWRSRPTAERREALHDALRTLPNLHDAYLDLAEIADPSSIQVLLLRLCVDYPEPKPLPSRWGGDCAQDHLTEVLRTVTNQDAGMWCSEWRGWLHAHGMKSWNEWIAEGFAQEGVTVSLPLTEQSFRSVVRFMADHPRWRSTNAWRVLSQLPRQELERRLEALARTGDRVTRLGIERARERLHGTD